MLWEFKLVLHVLINLSVNETFIAMINLKVISVYVTFIISTDLYRLFFNINSFLEYTTIMTLSVKFSSSLHISYFPPNNLVDLK